MPSLIFRFFLFFFLLLASPAFPPPSLTVFAFLFWQRRRTGRDISALAGDVLGDKHPPVRLGHGRNGREEGKRRRGVPLLFRQVVILGGIAFIQHSGSSIGEGRRLRTAPLLLRQGRGGANARRLQGIGLIGLLRPVFRRLMRRDEARVGGVLSGDRGGRLAVGLGQGAQAPPHGDGREVLPNRQVLVEEVVIRVVALGVVWREGEEKKKKESDSS